MIKKIFSLASISLALLLFLGAAPFTAKADAASDKAMSQKVTDSLGAYKSDIVVHTKKGKVYVSGMIESKKEKQEVLDRASKIAGKGNVVDNIVVPEDRD